MCAWAHAPNSSLQRFDQSPWLKDSPSNWNQFFTFDLWQYWAMCMIYHWAMSPALWNHLLNARLPQPYAVSGSLRPWCLHALMPSTSLCLDASCLKNCIFNTSLQVTATKSYLLITFFSFGSFVYLVSFWGETTIHWVNGSLAACGSVPSELFLIVLCLYSETIWDLLAWVCAGKASLLPK